MGNLYPICFGFFTTFRLRNGNKHISSLALLNCIRAIFIGPQPVSCWYIMYYIVVNTSLEGHLLVSFVLYCKTIYVLHVLQ